MLARSFNQHTTSNNVTSKAPHQTVTYAVNNNFRSGGYTADDVFKKYKGYYEVLCFLNNVTYAIAGFFFFMLFFTVSRCMAPHALSESNTSLSVSA